MTLSFEDDDRVNARKDLSQRVKTHAEVTRTSSTTEEEGWHVEIAVAVNSHPEGFERYIVGDLAGRESLHSSPQRNEQSQQGDLVSGYADDLAQVDCDCESRLLALDGLSCSAERVSTERARDGDGWFIKHETHERLWRSDRGFKCYHGSRRVPNQQEPFMDGGSDGDYVSHLAGHRLHRDLAAGRSVGPAIEAEHTKPGGQTTSYQSPCLGGAASGVDDEDRTSFAFVGNCEARPIIGGDFEGSTNHMTRIRAKSSLSPTVTSKTPPIAL